MTACVAAAVSAPLLLAALLLINYQETFRRRLTDSLTVRVAQSRRRSAPSGHDASPARQGYRHPRERPSCMGALLFVLENANPLTGINQVYFKF